MMTLWNSLSFQNLMSPVTSQLESLHDLVTVWLAVVLVMVTFIGGKILFSGFLVSLPLDSATLEVTWTLIPMVILITIALPSLNLLCLQDTALLPPKFSSKLISNQWNWQAEQGEEVLDLLLDSEKVDELSNFESPLLFPSNKLTRILLTSTDVLHSLGIPSLGLKLDSAPGRLNSVVFESKSGGLFPGSCYELCGSGHSAMPIYMLFI